jgi:hypothetical protein
VTGDPNQLGTSHRSAEHRLLAIERRLERDPELKTEYHRFMTEYEELGHMEPVTSPPKKTSCYYLPHHPVFKKAAPLPKLALCSMGVPSPPLDYHSMTYYKLALQFNKTCIQSYFAFEPIRCASQLTSQKCRQITIHPQDRDLQRILWRNSLDDPIQEYQLPTVMYGTSSAPFLATRCLKELADEN